MSSRYSLWISKDHEKVYNEIRELAESQGKNQMSKKFAEILEVGLACHKLGYILVDNKLYKPVK